MMMHQEPTVYVPTWSSLFDAPAVAAGPVSGGFFKETALPSLQRYSGGDPYDDFSDNSDVLNFAIDAYSCDEFRMYEFKVRRCARGRSHDWTECPYTHPGEKARRRDPRKYHYSGTACLDFRKGSCKRGDSCDMAHGVFECWLHPARYRTQPCKDGIACRRRVCFFAHTLDQLRVLPESPKTPLESYDGSPLRQHQQLMATAPAPLTLSPPFSPTGGGVGESLWPPMSPEAAAMRRTSCPVNEVLASLRKLQLEKVKSIPRHGCCIAFRFGSPTYGSGNTASGGFCSLPSTPTGFVNGFDGGFSEEEEEHAERVESWWELRPKMYERLSKERVTETGPDVEWVSELVM